MDDQIRERFLQDFAEIRKSYEQFQENKITLKQYRLVSGKHGIYPQPGTREDGKHLLRFRVAAGRIDKKKLRYLLHSFAKYKIDRIKLIHTQSIQIHDLSLETIFKFVLEAFDYGFISLGNGANYPRNVICSSLSGVEEGEFINVLPYAEAANRYLLDMINEISLPNKIEISFSNSPKNESHATFCDLGFAARKNKCFDIYIAGGLALEPRLGILVQENVSPKKILYYVQAMLDFYERYADALTVTSSVPAYLQKEFTKEEIRIKFLELLEETMQSKNLDLINIPRSVTKRGDGIQEENERIRRQKQMDLYTVEYLPICGYMDAEAFKKIYSNIEPMNQVELRLTPSSSIQIINLTASEAKRVYEATGGGAESEFQSSVSCAGSRYCTHGYADTEKLLYESLQKVYDADRKHVLPRIRISGCEISCSAHQVAKLGFQAVSVKGEDAYMVFHSGEGRQGRENFALRGSVLHAKQIPQFLEELRERLISEGQGFIEWMDGHQDQLGQLLEKYAKNSNSSAL